MGMTNVTSVQKDAERFYAMSGRIELLAAGASRLSDGLVVEGDVLGYVSGRIIVLKDVRSDRVVGCINVHKSPVRAIALAGSVLASSDVSGTILVHRVGFGGPELKHREWLGSDAGSAVISVLDDVVLSAGLDSVMRIWRLKDSEMVEEAAIGLGDGFLPECISLTQFNNSLLAAVGGSDRKLRLYLIHELSSVTFLGVLSGHKDWIRSLRFSDLTPEGNILLATASNDRTAQIWRLRTGLKADMAVSDVLDKNTTTFKIPQGHNDEVLVATKEAILAYHMDQVTAVRWTPKFQLATCSMDSSVALWSIDENHEWRPQVRLGLLGGANSHALGFFSVAVADEEEIFASSFSGGLFRWQRELDNQKWVSVLAPGGHSEEVWDARWDPSGRFAVSCSADKTTRIWAEHEGRWGEIARPQVHGHSVFGVSFVGKDGHDLVSVSEEKMARLFEAPKWFYQHMGIAGAESRPDAASMPALGLSNKPSEQHQEGLSSKEEQTDMQAVDSMTMPPFEEELMQGRLWPEMAKLYAHGNDLSCVASSPDGLVLATAANSKLRQQAAIVIWDVLSRSKRQEIEGHDLTVTAMMFSKDCNFLASVSRDRSFRVYENRQATNQGFALVYSKKNAHSRIINCIEWVHGTKMFATGSRDKTVKLHAGTIGNHWKEDEVLLSSLTLPGPVTALSWCPSALAVGLEDGQLHLFGVSDDGVATALCAVNPDLYPGARVRALHWRPVDDDEEGGAGRQLLIASEDHSVRIYSDLCT
ncbi:hypothetical protein NDN08_003925 [Rhodosorus marinus]|uniref:Elongator complex protein 2 n=1 Tax=Rhodosorus marinus TaxID=101924 RepID=A0AAV8UI89_9RHOD|nr:hypothetical protein NDN08_003925 [Rhodosorus marinus]